ELRTPLTNIIGFAHLLLDPLIGPTIGPITEKQRDYLGSIDKSSSALLAIINDILDLTTIDAGAMPLDLKEVDIRTAVDAAVLGSEHRGAGLGLSIVRSFVELHGGTVKLDSAVGRGTTVTCIFPLKRALQEAAAE